jgi:hypothetical protein
MLHTTTTTALDAQKHELIKPENSGDPNIELQI